MELEGGRPGERSRSRGSLRIAPRHARCWACLRQGLLGPRPLAAGRILAGPVSPHDVGAVLAQKVEFALRPQALGGVGLGLGRAAGLPRLQRHRARGLDRVYRRASRAGRSFLETYRVNGLAFLVARCARSSKCSLLGISPRSLRSLVEMRVDFPVVSPPGPRQLDGRGAAGARAARAPVTWSRNPDFKGPDQK